MSVSRHVSSSEGYPASFQVIYVMRRLAGDCVHTVCSDTEVAKTVKSTSIQRGLIQADYLFVGHSIRQFSLRRYDSTSLSDMVFLGM